MCCNDTGNHEQVSTQKTDGLQSKSKEQARDKEASAANHSYGTLSKSLQLPVPHTLEPLSVT